MAKHIIIISLIVGVMSGCTATSTNSRVTDDEPVQGTHELLPMTDSAAEKINGTPIQATVVQKFKQEPDPAEPELKKEPNSVPPAIQVTPTQEPLKSDPVPVSNTTTNLCAVEKACTKMSSCEEAYYHLNTCGFKKRDGDGDGVPCEDICPGG